MNEDQHSFLQLLCEKRHDMSYSEIAGYLNQLHAEAIQLFGDELSSDLFNIQDILDVWYELNHVEEDAITVQKIATRQINSLIEEFLDKIDNAYNTTYCQQINEGKL